MNGPVGNVADQLSGKLNIDATIDNLDGKQSDQKNATTYIMEAQADPQLMARQLQQLIHPPKKPARSNESPKQSAAPTSGEPSQPVHKEPHKNPVAPQKLFEPVQPNHDDSKGAQLPFEAI